TANPSVTTVGGAGSDGQVYNDAVQLRQDTVLADKASGNVTFKSTVDSQTAGNEKRLQVNTIGDEEFDGQVGRTVALKSLITDADAANRGGRTILNVTAGAAIN